MLHLNGIRKSYTTGTFTQTALDDVSITFRDNEFVAVLGPSGSGKTTLLNIVGGLDHADAGSLVIDGIDTSNYADRDWDTYRNNRIGFVFQSYNLIPHQSVLANVELALTLAGVSRTERRRQATAALAAVGLGDHVHKRPSQLSGGQMQRVAIARALINDPEILLADEPTGALDSHTSGQVMALLEEIARDRLVVMVTHNAELAEDHATRIVSLRDGQVEADTDPYVPGPGEGAAGRAGRRTAMSFLTAIALSFNNLMTKKGRTLMTAFAGSIGIIGIAAILALANGVNDYIKGVEEDTLSMYPLQIQSQGVDMTSLLLAGADLGQEAQGDAAEPGAVRQVEVMSRFFASVGSNDLAALKTFLDGDGGGIGAYANSIQYAYNVPPQIFAELPDGTVRQVNPDSTFAELGFGGGSSMSSLMSSTMSTNIFSEMLADMTLVEQQYEVLAGQWPDGHDEVVLVLTPSGGLSDWGFYTMGLRDPAELDEMVRALAEDRPIVTPAGGRDSFSYDEIMAVTFKLVPAAAYFAHDEVFDVWTDRSADPEHLADLVADGETVRISGIVRPRPGATATALQPGFYYSPDMITYLVEEAAGSGIVREQLAAPDVNVFSGRTFAEEQRSPEREGLDLTRLFTVDEDAIQAAFTFDESLLRIDPAGFDLAIPDLQIDPGALPELDLGDLSGALDLEFDVDLADLADLADLDPADLLEGIDLEGIDLADVDLDLDLADVDLGDLDLGDLDPADLAGLLDPAGLTDLAGRIVGAYAAYCAAGADCTDPLVSLEEFLATGEGVALLAEAEGVAQGLADELAQVIDQELVQGLVEGLVDQITEQITEQITQQFTEQFTQQFTEQLTARLQEALTGLTGQILERLAAEVEEQIAANSEALQARIQAAMATYLDQAVAAVGQQVQGQLGPALERRLAGAMERALAGLAENMSAAMGLDEEAFLAAFDLEMDEQELSQLLMAMMTTQRAGYDVNLVRLGYADFDRPSEISIYPVDFESKAEIVAILEAYNEARTAEGAEDKVITYTDIVGTLMSSVTTIINVVSYVLIAFVSISLVVSSIMIGVITYISVLERRKEIGILRSIGASKRDIRTVFNAETLIVGFVAGVIGIAVTLALTVPVNAIVSARFDIDQVAILPWQAGVVLVAISMGLTVLAGLIPASAASRADPVEALRSE